MTLYIDELRSWFELNKGDIFAGLVRLHVEYEPEDSNQAFRICHTAQKLAEVGQGLGFTLKQSARFKYKIDDRKWFLWHGEGNKCFSAFCPGEFGCLNVAFDDVDRWRLEVK